MLRAFHSGTGFPALAQLLNEIAKTYSTPITTEAEQQEQVALYEKYGQFQQWVIQHPQDPNLLIAYGNLFKQSDTPYAEFTLVIHPDFTRENLEVQLLNTIQHEALKQQATYISVLINARNEHLQLVLQNQNFKQHGGFRTMELDITRAVPLSELPFGFDLRTYEEVNDINVLVDIANRGWADLPGHKVTTPETTSQMLETSQENIFLLFDASNQVVGRVGVTLENDRGIVDSPAIVPAQRTPELYKLLVLVGVHDLTKRGCKYVQMYSWGDYDSTIAAYTELGFRTTIHEIGYRLDLL
jgi:N-acetylglutamate synthase-like GNAT family acetyltransferase